LIETVTFPPQFSNLDEQSVMSTTRKQTYNLNLGDFSGTSTSI
jgi:hypothetical protein